MKTHTFRTTPLNPFVVLLCTATSVLFPTFISDAIAATCPAGTVNGNTVSWQINADTRADFTFTLQGNVVSQMDLRITTKGPVVGDTLWNEAHIEDNGPGKTIAVYDYTVDQINGPVGNTNILGGGFIKDGVATYAIGAAAGISPEPSSDGWLFFMEGTTASCLSYLPNPDPRPFGASNAHDIIRVDASVTEIPALWRALVAEKNGLAAEVALLNAQITALRTQNESVTALNVLLSQENNQIKAQNGILQGNITTIKGGTFFDLGRSTKMLGKICSPILKNADTKTARKFRRLVKRTTIANSKNVLLAQSNGNAVKKPTKGDL